MLNKKTLGGIVLGGFLLILGGCQIPRPNQPPIACFSASPLSGVAPLEVTFDASCSRDNDGNIVRYVLYPGDGGIIQSNSPIIRYIYRHPGNYVPRLFVEDNRGATSESIGPTINVIENKPPVACFTVTQISWNVFVFSPHCSYDPDGVIVESIWRIDGREFWYSGLRAIRVEFTRPGIYLVTLIVKDNHGATSSWSLQVSVIAPLPPPPAPPSLNEKEEKDPFLIETLD
ncbi:MAG: PKD domain-containing protein [Candidatus Aenigmatarchaeota archaeon]